MDKINRSYYIAETPEYLPTSTEEGAVYYVKSNSGMYIDYDGERNQICAPEVWVKVKKPDPWEEIINNQNYATDYQIGKLVDLDFGEYGVHPMELVAIDTDNKADGSGKARITWISKDIVTMHNMNDSNENQSSWEDSSLRAWLRDNVFANMPEILQENIVEVNKGCCIPEEPYYNVVKDNIWIPSCGEIRGGIGFEDTEDGIWYGQIFKSDNIEFDDGEWYKYPYCQKNYAQSEYSYSSWWVRTRDKDGNYVFIQDTGSIYGHHEPATELGVVIGFCL